MTKPIRKKELAALLNQQDKSYHAYEYEHFLRNLTKQVQQILLNGDTLHLEGIGTYGTKLTNPCTRKHPGTGVVTKFEGNYRMKFSPARSLVEMLKAKEVK